MNNFHNKCDDDCNNKEQHINNNNGQQQLWIMDCGMDLSCEAIMGSVEKRN